MNRNVNPRNEAVFATHPEWFGEDFNKYGRYLSVGDGWIPLVETMLKDLDVVLKLTPLPGFTFHQIKEKFGLLRVYYAPMRADIDEMIIHYEALSGRTCEKCGQPGRPRSGGWIRTLCDEHARKEV